MGVVAASGANDVSTQTRATLTANTEVQADEDLHTPIAVAAPSAMVNGSAMSTPPRAQRAAMLDAMDLTPTPNAIRAGAQQGLAPVPVPTRDSFLLSQDSLFQPRDEDARTITMETPTESEWTDAPQSMPPTPSGLSEFHSVASGADFGFQSESDRESIRAGRVGVYGDEPLRQFDTKSVDAVPLPAQKPEVRDRAMQTDPPVPLTPIGFQRIGAPSQFKYIPSSPATPQMSEPSAVAMGKRPMPAPRESFDTYSRARADRRQSIESAMSDASSMRSIASPKPKPVGPVVQIDRTRPPTMMLPPPPPMPPPPMPNPSLVRRPTGNGAPPRPTSPPPPELIQRATTPTLGGPSSLLVPQRAYGGSRHLGTSMPPSPAGGLRQPPSTSSFRSTPNASAGARPAQGASMVSGSSRRPSISSSRGSSEQHRTRFAPAPEAQHQTSSTDPAVIHAITQTMIGEFLFKYTRKVVGKGHGEKRHKRFFWVHPYTKTLYWSDADPGANGVIESSAKSGKSAVLKH
ncbi:hypothetical protein FRC08_002820 [Ceratobasidium sp. 394]|nr:hypothetical protein FRC08_002820 [Ceratobasidium sp. 394]